MRDIGSRNGTWLNEERLPVGERRPLAPGDTLCFGSLIERWEVAHTGAPGLIAVGPGGALRPERAGLLALPSADAPSATLFADGGGWALDGEGLPEAAHEGMKIPVEGADWTVRLPVTPVEGALPSTWDVANELPLQAAELHFRVSRDQEHVEVALRGGEQLSALSARAHHFLLLALARARLEDQAARVSADEQGWVYVEALCDMLRIDLALLNLHVFRARHQLAEAGVARAGRLIERRRLSRQIRLGVELISVTTT